MGVYQIVSSKLRPWLKTSEIRSPTSSSTALLLSAGTDRLGPEDPLPSSTISRRGVARPRTLSAAYDVIVISTSHRFGNRSPILVTCTTKQNSQLAQHQLNHDDSGINEFRLPTCCELSRVLCVINLHQTGKLMYCLHKRHDQNSFFHAVNNKKKAS